jgi:hypothetical protein
MHKFLLRALGIGASAILAIALGYGSAGATNGGKVTLCHNGHTITISENALKGHFDHDGQPAVGHENDYLGECKTPPTTVPEPPTTVPEPPTTAPPVDEPPVTVPPVVIVRSAPPAPPASPVVAQPSVTG